MQFKKQHIKLQHLHLPKFFIPQIQTTIQTNEQLKKNYAYIYSAQISMHNAKQSIYLNIFNKMKRTSICH